MSRKKWQKNVKKVGFYGKSREFEGIFGENGGENGEKC